MFEMPIRIGFKSELQMLATKQIIEDLKMSWADVLRIGLISLEKKKEDLQLINEMDTSLEAYFYMRQAKNERGVRTWNAAKVLATKGRAKNFVKVKIYEMTKLSDCSVIILYTDSETKPGEFKSIKKLIKWVDIKITKAFFGQSETKGYKHNG